MSRMLHLITNLGNEQEIFKWFTSSVAAHDLAANGALFGLSVIEKQRLYNWCWANFGSSRGHGRWQYVDLDGDALFEFHWHRDVMLFVTAWQSTPLSINGD